jgi:hypothetical protein
MPTKKTTGNKLADMMYGSGEIRPTPQSRITGPIANAVRKAQEFASQYEVDPRVPLLGGTSVDELLSLPGAASLLEDVSYNGMGALIRGGNAATGGIGTFRLDPRIIDTADLVGTATGVGALGKGAVKTGAKGAMAAGRAGERMAEKYVPKIMERGGAGADILQGMSKGTVSPMDVYHGSPHKFDKFDSSKIGTGEGAQSYGQGLYFAESPEVAKSYQPRSPKFEQKLINLYQKASSISNYPMMEVLEDAMLHRAPSEIIKKFTNVDDGYTSQHAKAAQDFAKWYSKNEPEVGGLYKVDLPDDQIAKMLDWDKPLSQQAPEVRSMVQQAFPPTYINGRFVDPMRSQSGGRAMLDELGMIADKRGEPGFRQAEAVLRQAGIPGIRYLDADSRTAAEGTSNFVVFPGEEKSLKILERDGKPLVVPSEPEGMARGGRVHISDDPDVMALELAGGGKVGFLTEGIKAAAKALKPAKEAAAPMKASEALGRIEGRPLVITQADRTKVGGGYLGGPGFSGLQLEDPAYRAAEAAWAVKNPGVAKMILGGSKAAGKDPVYAAMLGTPTQHQSNQMVFDKLYGDFKKAAKKGNLDQDLRDRINMRLVNTVDKEGNNIFPPDVDILGKNFKELANTFDRRAVTANLIGGMGVGGKKGQIIDYDKIIRQTTDPLLIDAPTGALGNRLFTLSGGIIDRPDLHPAFPTIMQGEDLGVSFNPVARDLIMKDFTEKTMREKGRAPGYMDYTRGYPPSQIITEDILTEMQKLGFKEGGAVSFTDDPDTMALELAGGGKVGAVTNLLKGFFSAVDKTAQNLKRPAGTGKEFMAEVRAAPGIKATELKGRKLAEIEAMPKMTKDQFLKELEARPPVKIEEKVFGNPSQKEIDALADKLAYDKAVESARNYGERGDDIDALAEENYLSNIRNNFEELREEARLSLIDEGLLDENVGKFKPSFHEKYTIPGGENYREILLKMPAAKGEGFPGFGGHFGGEPNILASIRVSDRIGPNGEKILHVEEIQSDWHQAGRKKGYKKQGELPQGHEIEQEELGLYVIRNQNGEVVSSGPTAQLALDSLDTGHQKSAVPDAPFKKDWQELALRRVMQEAADGGYDRVALTKGAEQADRYDLSKQISRVEWKTRGDEPGKLMAYDKVGNRVIEKEMSPDELADHIGKDVAEKLIKSDVALQTERGHEIRELSGLDLKTGGEGMEGFYDKMLPDYLNKLGNQYGVQVGEIDVIAKPSTIEKAGTSFYQTAEQKKPVHSFEVTPQMRQDITEKGLPLYQQIGIPVGAGTAGTGTTTIDPEGLGTNDEQQVQNPVNFTENPDAMLLELMQRN